jgi:hypothetical protein
LFYTGRDAVNWRIGYASASTLADLKTVSRNYMSALNGEVIFVRHRYFGSNPKTNGI